MFIGADPVPLGKIHIDGIKDLTRVGTVLTKDYREPSIFDLEDLQSPPNMNSFDSVSNIDAIMKSKELAKSDSKSLETSPDYSDDEDSETKKNNQTSI